MARKLSSRETILLGVLAAVAVVVVYYSSGGSVTSRATAAKQDREKDELNDPPVVQLALLERGAEPYDADGRDLFKYSERPATPWELEARRRADEERRRRMEEEAERRRKQQEEARQRQIEQAAAAPGPVGPRPPMPGFDYIGYLGPKDDKIAVFDKGNRKEEVLLARAGDVVEKEFVVKEIGYLTVVLGYTDERFQHTTKELRMKNTK